MSSGATIQIDIFSGRPNPELELHGADANRLREMLQRPREPRKDYAVPDQLGARGFVARFNEDPKEYRIVGDTLVIDGQAFLDPQRETEDFVISLLPGALKAQFLPLLRPGPPR
jgi:hypothetical protein